MLRAVLASAVITGSMLAGAAVVQAQEMVPCARENGFCRVPYPTRVIYGARGWNSERFVQGRGIPCSNRFFGDPAPGIAKRCAYVVRYERRGPRRWREEFRGPPPGPPGYNPRYRDYDRGYYGQPY
jgi:hypothetical protein